MVYRGDFPFRRRGGWRVAGGWVVRVGWQKEGPLLEVAENSKPIRSVEVRMCLRCLHVHSDIGGARRGLGKVGAPSLAQHTRRLNA